MTNKPTVSIVILSYNTKDLLKRCLQSLQKVRNEVSFEILVVDNDSGDGSSQMVRKDFPEVRLVQNDVNLGFAAGNNQARPYCQGKYVLILNSDTEVPAKTIQATVGYLDQNPRVGAVTCKMVLPNGRLDRDARRSFPTPWVALTHFSHLDRVFPKSELFSRYWYGYVPVNKVHEIDVTQGAFALIRRDLMEKIAWFSEDYFLDGEDIDLSWKIHEAGYKIVYYPKVSILHVKGASKGKSKHLAKKPDFPDRVKFAMAGVDSMEIFYRSRLWQRYPIILNLLVILAIKVVKVFRYTKLLLS